MREERITFFSGGAKLAGILRLPDGATGPYGGIVQGPGWLGLKDAKLYLPYHEALTAAGFAVLIFDYRGFGDSEGTRENLDPGNQLEDLVNAVTYLSTREDIDSAALGTFGSGGTGGGNAVMLSAHDDRIRCAVSQVPVADGEDWLKRMRREYEWYEFLDRLEQDRRVRVLEGEGELVHPREEIMVPTPERKTTNVKSDVDGRVPEKVYLQSAEKIMAYRPIDVAPSVSHLMIIAVEDDAVTPTDHAVALYDAAASPKRLVLQGDTTHYAAYKQYGDRVIPEIVAWFSQYLAPGPVRVRESYPLQSIERVLGDAGGEG
jgi:dipeptidyl aminopeptidase/acylaminoacyl peptidase